MKSLQQHIYEKLVINKNYIDDEICLIYKINKKEQIKIFNNAWPQFNYYKYNVYINGEQILLDDSGFTEEEFNPGEYTICINKTDNMTTCYWMFGFCNHLIKVIKFNINKIYSCGNMFAWCKNLEEVPLFDISKVENFDYMFNFCHNLSMETRKEWKQVYNFNTNKKR